MTQWERGGGNSWKLHAPLEDLHVCWEMLEDGEKVSENVLPREGTKSELLF